MKTAVSVGAMKGVGEVADVAKVDEVAGEAVAVVGRGEVEVAAVDRGAEVGHPGAVAAEDSGVGVKEDAAAATRLRP